MKKISILSLTALLIMAVILTGCGGGGKSNNSEDTGVAFTMIAVPAVSSFPTGTGDVVNGSVASAYYIAETEVTYELWRAVYAWATSADRGTAVYSFARSGSQGGNCGEGEEQAATNQQPVTEVSWRDAMVWCNALTEYYNAKHGTTYKCVYYTDQNYNTPLRTSTNATTISTDAGSEDKPYIYATSGVGNTEMANCAATGFRLPTGNEWELAARYIDGTKYYSGMYASGADAAVYVTSGGTDYDGDGDIQYTADVAVCSSLVTLAVKSRSPNKLGLYDMSGNVREWCFDWSEYISDNRVVHSGNGFNSATSQMIGAIDTGNPIGYDVSIGFRPVRTQ